MYGSTEINIIENPFILHYRLGKTCPTPHNNELTFGISTDRLSNTTTLFARNATLQSMILMNI